MEKKENAKILTKKLFNNICLKISRHVYGKGYITLNL